MGYRSEVRIMTTQDGFNKMIEIHNNLFEDSNCSYRLLPDNKDGKAPMFKIFGEDKYTIIFGWDWIKWYDSYYDQVDLVEQTLMYADECDIPWQFIRIGEDYDDVEEKSSDAFWNNDIGCMSVSRRVEW